VKRERVRRAACSEYNAITDAAVKGPGITPATQKRLDKLRKEIEKLGGFKT
jgi:hypothetical protein